MVQEISTGLPGGDWDSELFAHGGHFMQSRSWLEVQQALGDEVFAQQGDGWRWAGVVHRGRSIRYAYSPYGPSVDDPSRLGAAVEAMRRSGAALGVDFVRVEPDLEVEKGQLTRLGALPSRSVQPRHTLVLDLTRPEPELRSDLTSGRRRSINTATAKGIAVRRTREMAEVEHFLQLIRKTGERNGFAPHSDAYYRTVCRVLFEREAASLYLADVEGESVAGVIAFESPTTGYYAHAAADAERSRQIIAAAPLAWRIVLDCRAEGRRAFDFWGVLPDDTADHPWAGLSRFKKTFGGRLVTRPGTFDLPVRPWRYRLYRTARLARSAHGAGR